MPFQARQRDTVFVCLVIVSIGVLTPPAAAVQCYCYNGRAASSDSCDCSCAANYLPPTCTFGISDSVSLTFALNVSASSFISELFVNAVGYAASSTATFVGAKNISKFNAVTCVVKVPGYTVQRVIDSVAYRDPWVSQYGVVSVDVVTPSVSSSSTSDLFGIDYNIYQQDNITITVTGIVYLGSALILTLLLIWIELQFSTNTDEHRMAAPNRAKNNAAKNKAAKNNAAKNNAAQHVRRDNYVTEE